MKDSLHVCWNKRNVQGSAQTEPAWEKGCLSPPLLCPFQMMALPAAPPLLQALAAHGWSSHPRQRAAGAARLEHREKGNHYPPEQGTRGAWSKCSKTQMPSPCPSPVTKAIVLTLTLRCFSTFYMLFIQFFTPFLQFKTQGHQSESLGTVQSLLWRQVPSTAVAPEVSCPAHWSTRWLPEGASGGRGGGCRETFPSLLRLPESTKSCDTGAEARLEWTVQVTLSHRGDGSCSTAWRMSHHRAVSRENA